MDGKRRRAGVNLGREGDKFGRVGWTEKTTV